jgi:hypothetical protein
MVGLGSSAWMAAAVFLLVLALCLISLRGTTRWVAVLILLGIGIGLWLALVRPACSSRFDL